MAKRTRFDITFEDWAIGVGIAVILSTICFVLILLARMLLLHGVPIDPLPQPGIMPFGR
jgi:hypothetical protein